MDLERGRGRIWGEYKTLKINLKKYGSKNSRKAQGYTWILVRGKYNGQCERGKHENSVEARHMHMHPDHLSNGKESEKHLQHLL